MSNITGVFTDSYDYEAFGEIQNQTGATENNYLFTGEQFDSSLNQYYLRARYYDQNIGRFTQYDTWQGNNSDPITLHKYLYANANPAIYTDPSGNFSIGSLMSAVNVMANLVTVAQGAYDVFQIATGEGEFSASQFGMGLLLSRIPNSSLARSMASKYKFNTGKDLIIPCVKNSFVAGTLIHTNKGLVPIENISIGDYVLSFDEKTSKQVYQKVIHLIQNEAEYELINIEIQGGEFFLSTPNHSFFIDGIWKNASELSINQAVSLFRGYLPIVNISSGRQYTSVYNFTVSDTHTYYIGNAGVLVHNAGKDCVISVNNMAEFFDTAFGVGIKNSAAKTSKRFQGQSIYKATSDSAGISKGDYFYLDDLHKDHLEVFDKNGNFIKAINLDGSLNHDKTANGYGRSIKKLL